MIRMSQPSGQAGPEVGFSVNGQNNQVPAEPISEPPTATTSHIHRRPRTPAESFKPAKLGKDRHKQASQDPKSVRDMIAMVSHDLRTPLASIHGTLALLRLGVCGQLPPQALEAIQIAERGSTRLIKLINDLLDIEKLESGKPVISLGAGNTKTIIDKSIDAVSGLTQIFNIRIQVPERNFEVYADEDRIVQVLVNLLSNALKFSPNGSTVTISIRRRGNDLEFRVADQGPGIAADAQSELFKRFSQIQTVASGKLTGSGLGLVISKAIVQAHRGEIGVESKLGHGATFWFTLPAAS
jgi:signal transduction histidine kinase